MLRAEVFGDLCARNNLRDICTHSDYETVPEGRVKWAKQYNLPDGHEELQEQGICSGV